MTFRLGAEPVFSDDALSQNAFLGGKVQILQPKSGYRAGVDPVLLAASVCAESGQSVLELGCGGGQALICLGARISDLALSGVELQEAYADLARRNGDLNGLKLAITCADLTDLPAELKQQRFDHIIANPPYYRAGAHSQAQDSGRRRALGEATPLRVWVEVASRRLAPKGYFYMIQKANRLADVLSAFADHLGSIEVLPIAARAGREAELILVRARKSGRADLRLHAPFVLHEGTHHAGDRPDYRPEVEDILRNGAALAWTK